MLLVQTGVRYFEDKGQKIVYIASQQIPKHFFASSLLVQKQVILSGQL